MSPGCNLWMPILRIQMLILQTSTCRVKFKYIKNAYICLPLHICRMRNRTVKLLRKPLRFLAMIHDFGFSIAYSIAIFVIKSFVYLDCKVFFGMDLYLHGALQCLVQFLNTEYRKQIRNRYAIYRKKITVVLKIYMQKEHMNHLI